MRSPFPTLRARTQEDGGADASIEARDDGASDAGLDASDDPANSTDASGDALMVTTRRTVDLSPMARAPAPLELPRATQAYAHRSTWESRSHRALRSMLSAT